LDLPSGRGVTFAWLAEADGTAQAVSVARATVPGFPQGHGPRYPWPDEGSDRCDLTVTGCDVRFVTCLLPEGVEELTLRKVEPGVWEAVWEGGSDRFILPPEIEAVPDDAPVTDEQMVEKHTLCDLDEAPFALLDEPDAALLAALDDPPIAAWRRTGAAMQTLTARGNANALPKIMALLDDARQNYTVHSVAAWCLGHARHEPALAVLLGHGEDGEAGQDGRVSRARQENTFSGSVPITLACEENK
jgi:hypothetical protein